jgi:hypothetical protein
VIAPLVVIGELDGPTVDAQLALAARDTKYPGKIDLKVVLEPRFRALIVEAPMAPVRQDAPLDLAVRLNVRTRQVADDLA